MRIPGTQINVSRITLLVVAVAVLLVPFPTTVVPEWSLKVEDQFGRPVVGTVVREHWQHWSLESTGHEEDRKTDSAGRVIFPSRLIAYPLIYRIPPTILAALSVFAHGSLGADAYIIAVE